MISLFFTKRKSICWQKYYLYSKQQCESCVRDLLVLFSFFFFFSDNESAINENLSFAGYLSGIWLLNGSKLDINRKHDNDITIFCDDVIIKVFWRIFGFSCQFQLLVQFWWQYITGSGIMTILFYKWLTRNPKIRNTTVWVLLITWRLEQFRDNKLDTNIFYKLLLNAAKCLGYFYCYVVIKVKPTRGQWCGEITHTPTTQILVKDYHIKI